MVIRQMEKITRIPKVTQPKPIYSGECGVKIGEVRGGIVVIFGRHHGQHHATVLQPGKAEKILDKPFPAMQD